MRSAPEDPTTDRPHRPAPSVGTAAAVGAGAFLATGAALTTAARVMARMPLVPSTSPLAAPDLEVVAAGADALVLRESVEAARPGVLALRQDGGSVHVRLGEIAERPAEDLVRRPLLAQDTPRPAHAGPAHSNGFFWAGDPRSAHGLEFQEIDVHSPVGPMPAWLVPAGDGARWAVLVHGHGATRGEGLRSLPLLHALGITALVITYRNDLGAPPSVDRLHHLGSAEWEDCSAAIEAALERGARSVVLMGWSMGGGIALRTARLSPHRDRIEALVLDSPAIDWRQILQHHAAQVRAPHAVRRGAMWMMGSVAGARMVQLHDPIALHEMTVETYRESLAQPTLLLHAGADTTVPLDASRRLADARPDLVEYHEVDGATHTREWNVDPAVWERTVARFLIEHLQLPVDPQSLPLPVRDPAAAPQEGATGRRL
ncbi:alpha/beta fold hydrolase [Brachybacterium sp. EF45031]|uniref:alpha/beta hydrolase family protein n=1 Tax=Brachybacterium sillae TaxID=2810536 RepID=UPI00217E2DFB|nr:lysophospholipase [Brachybacterium sillae]MCS6712708.1 alpha/beta fold hydrolase [Brachybacterium sillae]